MTDFSANFSLFPAKEKKSEKSPDSSGNIEFAVSDIPAVIEHLQTAERQTNYKEIEVVKLRVAGWNTESKGGMRYVNGKVSPPMAQSATPAQAFSTQELPF